MTTGRKVQISDSRKSELSDHKRDENENFVNPPRL